ncbi:unnamed protein product [Brassica oleracea var. botrytis]
MLFFDALKVMSGIDRISELPESLLTQILSFLPSKQSVQTSVLSTRWKNLYLNVPGLDLNLSAIPYDADEMLLSFLSFIDKLLESSPESKLFKVKVKCRDTMIDGFRDRIGIMIDRGTQHLDVESSTYDIEDDSFHHPCVDFMPMNLYTSKTLVYLKLTSSGLDDPGFVFMPCLKFMHLEEVKWRVHLEKLLSGCPVLEELALLRDLDDDYAVAYDEFTVMRVRAQSLKRFRVLPLRQVRDCRSRVNCTLEIDAPGLKHMSLGEDQFDSIVVKNLTSLLVVELDIKFFVKFGVIFNPWNLAKSNEIRDFLNGISSVRHMIISAKTVKALEYYSQAEMIPKFNNLSRLQAMFHSNLLQFLPAFLECFPNLKHLVLKVVHSEEMGEGLELTDVPRCVSSTLECVEIQEKLELEEGKMKATSYFLGNSAVLKKLILSPTTYDPRDVLESETWEKDTYTFRLSDRNILDLSDNYAWYNIQDLSHIALDDSRPPHLYPRIVILDTCTFRLSDRNILDLSDNYAWYNTQGFRFVMSGVDRISELPESLLTQILSYLPTNQSVQTTVLSKRWENVWLSVPCLDFDLHSSVVPYHDNQVLFTFLDNLLNFSPELSLLKVKVKCRDMMIDGFMERLGTVISRGTEHLDVESSTDYIDDYTNSVTLPCVEFMPMNLYASKKLVYLKLTSSGLRDPGFVYMPCLKFMHLEEVKWRVHLEKRRTLVYLKLTSSVLGYPVVVFMPCLKFMHLEEVKWRVHLAKLISGCPVLEELTLLRDPEDEYKALLVRTRSLKRFRVLPLRNGYVRSRVKCTLKIDAPGLEHMSLGDDQICSIVVKNLTCLLVVELDVKFRVLVNTWNVSKINVIRDFLNGISCARHMIISAKTVQALARYSQLGMIPKFNNLSRLQAVFRSKLVQFLPAFLECCPNLKHLILVLHPEEMEEELELTDVPQCVSTTLECVEIQDKFEWEEGKMKVASYFLENSAVLEKLILSPTAYNQNIYEKVNKLTKRSPVCQIIHE